MLNVDGVEWLLEMKDYCSWWRFGGEVFETFKDVEVGIVVLYRLWSLPWLQRKEQVFLGVSYAWYVTLWLGCWYKMVM